MKLNYIKSQSVNCPDLVDTTSSKVVVYLRKNIIELTHHDIELDKNVTCYEYDEAKLTKEEYEQYLKELEIIDIQQQRADIDYIALMSGIDLQEV